ncbi:hypothetical protein AIOL_004686 [Candidatus Rhodobacter oscarellae]|uniref:DUF4189 domain-containing protein n=1 Tax=Candidatus Rhodobacter oscarellae TaxID=1675527 RepID=A0A0J9H1V8_9RHOB|nr:DUF4189 domain-containing protein [Candidatus Rhodobacter lobularis]KMW59703.1 hypothetical protein AIOL_004686 [Candidatus Rhodobacter lobularis]
MRHAILVAAAAALLHLGSAAALACGYQDCWGAVGIGPNGVWGYSTGYPSENGALDRLFGECPNCEQWYSFVNACGAIASASDGAWGSGWGDTQELAEYYAVDTCLDYSNSGNCQVRVWACSY